MMFTRYLLCTAALLTSNSSIAASFDCKKASTAMEQLICSDAQLSAIDESLNAAYKTALLNAQDKVFFTQWQREWLQSYELTSCKSTECLRTAFSSRVDMLNQVATDKNSLLWNGKYTRFIDGEEDYNSSKILLIGLKANKIFVSGLSLWEGPNAKISGAHTGEIEGIGVVSGNRAIFDLGACQAVMVLKQPALVVESESGCGGMNVTFVGGLYKR